MNIPQKAVPCWFVSDAEMIQAIRGNRPYCETTQPYAYFARKQKPSDYTLEGYIGHRDYPEEFHSRMLTNFNYFDDYLQRKPVYLTFDRTTLYRITEIFPSDPLLFTLTRTDKLMINPEEIYQLLFKEQWPAIIEVLHKHKKDIAAEPALQHAARTFETVFLQKLDTFALDDSRITEVLEMLYLIHFGKFYVLNEENLQKLTIELARRLPLKDAYNYAKKYPDDKFCTPIIRRYQKEYPDKPARKTYAPMNYNWVELYNRLFELINNQGDTATYFSGPRFMDALREVVPYAPSYTQYIQLRNDAGKSTSRKIFYYDLLMEQDEADRVAIIEKILGIVRPFEEQKSAAIDLLLGKKGTEQSPKRKLTAEEVAVTVTTGHPVVFISYSWDSEPHKEWVLALANKLAGNGIEVLLDRYVLKPGKSIPHFVERSIARADRVLIIFTPNYKLKADNRSGGVGYEYSIMNAGLYENQTGNEKVIPVLRQGEMHDSIPEFMHQYIHLDLRNDDNFDISFTDLLREIFDEPAIKQPEIGSKPMFD